MGGVSVRKLAWVSFGLAGALVAVLVTLVVAIRFFGAGPYVAAAFEYSVEYSRGLGSHETTLVSVRVGPAFPAEVQFADGRPLFPVEIRQRDGRPFTGAVYGTAFGDSVLFDCVEWTGQYRNGKRHGTFKDIPNCYGPNTKTYVYEEGVLAP